MTYMYLCGTEGSNMVRYKYTSIYDIHFDYDLLKPWYRNIQYAIQGHIHRLYCTTVETHSKVQMSYTWSLKLSNHEPG